MSAEIIKHGAPGGCRVSLIDKLPLDGPMLLQYFPVYACNLRCKYCLFSVHPSEREFVTSISRMKYHVFVKSILDAQQFKDTLKVIRFVGMGEPLLHRHLPQMIRFAKDKFPEVRLEVITNGTLLNKTLSTKLASSGLDRMIISIQGITDAQYTKINRVTRIFNSAKLFSEIKYLHDNSDIHIHAKIIDLALKEGDKEKFYDIFKDKCSSMGVEHASPIYPGVAINDTLGTSGETQFNEKTRRLEICPQPFFTMQINPDGNVVPCYSVTYPQIWGNVKRKTLYEIWHGDMAKTFRKRLIKEGRVCNKICNDCKISEFRFNKEDSLDEHKERLTSLYC